MSSYYDNAPVGTIASDEDVNDPSKWLDCDGSVLDTVTYPELALLLSDGAHYATIEQWRTALDATNRGFAFSPDGSLLAVVMTPDSFTTIGSGNPVYRVFNTSDWTEVAGIPDLTATKSAVEANACAFSPDGSMLAIGYEVSQFDQGLAVLSTADWSFIAGTPTPSNKIYHLAFSPDSSMLAYGMAFDFFIYNTSDWTSRGGVLLNFSSHGGIAFSPDGTKVACVWDDPDDSVGYTVYNTADFSIASTGESLHWVSGSDNKLGTTRPSFSSDSTQLAIAGEQLGVPYLIDTVTWGEAHPFPRGVLENGVRVSNPERVFSAEFSPGGSFFVTNKLPVIEDEGAQAVFRVNDWQDVSPRFPAAIKNSADLFTFSNNEALLVFRPGTGFDFSGFDVLERRTGKILPWAKPTLRRTPGTLILYRPLKIRALP